LLLRSDYLLSDTPQFILYFSNASKLFSTNPNFNSTAPIHGFGQAKLADGGLILGSRQFTQLPQLPLKMRLNLKVVKIDSK